MSNHHHTPHEQNDNTYQTGFTDQPRQRSGGLVAVLLVLTIFLGSLASALGILNLQLLMQLADRPQQTVPVDVYNSPSSVADTADDILDTDDTPAPQVPAVRNARLELQAHDPRFDAYGTMSSQDIFDRNAPSMVDVLCDSRQSSETGMGIVISAEGYILTSTHLVESASRIYVRLQDGTACRAALVGMDALTDLAVIYIEGQTLTPAQFCDSSKAADGDPILVSALLTTEPYSLFTEGFLNARLPVSLGDHQLELLQTTVGSHDGPVFSHCGQILGMCSSQVSTYFDLYLQSSTGYAIPSTTVKEVTDQLLEFGFVPGRPSLGIRTEAISKVYQQYWNLPGGLRLLSVNERAQSQGLQEGDILLALNGQRLTANEDLHRLLLESDIGQSVTAVIFREGTELSLSLTIFDLAE